MNARVVVKLAVVSVLLALIPLASELVFIPLHRREIAQPALAPVNAIGRVLATPGVPIVEMLGLRSESHTTTAGALLTSIIAAIAYLVALGVAYHIWRRINEHSPTVAAEPADAPQVFSRRGLLRGGMQAATACGAAIAGYSLAYEPNTLRITRVNVPIRDLPESLAGLRIAHLTDIHHCAWHTTAWLNDIVEQTNSLDADLVALTGDYVARSPDYIEPVAAAMAHLKPRIGAVATLGNHDWWENGPRMIAALNAGGIPTIDNQRLFLTPQRGLVHAPIPSGLCIAGVGDLWTHICNLDAALADVPIGLPRILLSHNPDVAESPRLLKGDLRVDLMLSGHTHGGQIRLPLIGTPITNSRFGSKYAAGLVQGPRCPVFISRGIGTTVLPIRLGVPPEIALIELHRA